jgi:hypothetical protein
MSIGAPADGAYQKATLPDEREAQEKELVGAPEATGRRVFIGPSRVARRHVGAEVAPGPRRRDEQRASWGRS